MNQASLPVDGGPPVEVRRSARRRKTMTAFREGETIVVVIPASMSRAEEARQVPALVARLQSKLARRRPPAADDELQARAHELAGRYLRGADGRAPEPASVRWVGNMSTRWASCTVETAEIRLSERLREMPRWVVDYVLLHELAHLYEPDHSARFWALLGGYAKTERARGFLEGWAAAAGSLTLADVSEPPAPGS